MKFLMFAVVFGGTLLAQEPAAPAPQQAPANPGQSNVAATLHVYAYPNKNQTQDQQLKDETDCYHSAQVQAAPNQNAQAGQEGQQDQSGKAGKGATAKGTAGGAAGGAAIGAVAGNAGEGAAIGAATGAAVGHRKKKKAQEKAQEQQQQQQQSQQTQASDNLKRAYTACMEARNYTVK
jgi:hypothetical protein